MAGLDKVIAHCHDVAMSKQPTIARRYAASVYHDEPEDAATDSRMVGTFTTREEALHAARRTMGGYWNGGASVDRGDHLLTRWGEWELVHEYDANCYVSPDGAPDEYEWGHLE